VKVNSTTTLIKEGTHLREFNNSEVAKLNCTGAGEEHCQAE